MRVTKRQVTLPIGRAARIASEIDALRSACCRAAEALLQDKAMDPEEFEECARLDEALAEAHRLLKSKVRNILLSRIRRCTKAL